MWETLKRFGFSQGNLLEPSLGIGNFFQHYGCRSDDPPLWGRDRSCECAYRKNNSTKRLRSHRPDSKIPGMRITFSYCAIGNVPFGDYQVADARYDLLSSRKSMNIFLIRSVDLMRAGGIAILITAKGTLDGANASFRKLLDKKGGTDWSSAASHRSISGNGRDESHQ